MCGWHASCECRPQIVVNRPTLSLVSQHLYSGPPPVTDDCQTVRTWMWVLMQPCMGCWGEHNKKDQSVQIRTVGHCLYHGCCQSQRGQDVCVGDHWGSQSETPSIRSLFTAIPLSQKFDCRRAIGGHGVTWRMLAASSEKMPGQESREVLMEETRSVCRHARTGEKIQRCFNVGEKKKILFRTQIKFYIFRFALTNFCFSIKFEMTNCWIHHINWT